MDCAEKLRWLLSGGTLANGCARVDSILSSAANLEMTSSSILEALFGESREEVSLEVQN